jgi:threonine/homoserine/homoserine lactone efflux protein
MAMAGPARPAAMAMVSTSARPSPYDRRRLTGWRQGFLSNITNPKVLTFYLSVLPQFLPRDHVRPGDLVALVLTHAVISLVWLSAIVAALGGVRSWLRQRAVRRALDGVTGCALLGFSAKLAREHP